ncbi:MAG: hypothetical protein JW820_06140 [Spirochaetales bacterium]|nr:hypothetical protein [Spirochaetales bacterium]
MKKVIASMALLLFLGASGTPWAQEEQVEGERAALAAVDSLGLIFNTTDILFEMESFRGGIGAELGLQRFAIRGWLDLEFQTQFNPFSFTLGGAFKKRILPGRVSPYGGGYLEIGFAHLRTGSDPSYWYRTNALVMTLGGMLGVEVFVFDFLSLFAEYALPFEIKYTHTAESIAGSETVTNDWDYGMDIGLGNSARIGIVVYLIQKNPPPPWKRPGDDKT